VATGATLGELIEEVQYEVGDSTSPAVGQAFRAHIANRIRRVYRKLYFDHDWRHLREWRDISTAAGQRYYDYPSGVVLEQVTSVHIKWSDDWQPLLDGLQIEDMNAFDSDDGVRSDPALCWRPYGPSQIEVWPIPASAYPVRFVTRKAFTPLVDEDDRCDLDTDLVVQFAAARILAPRDPDEARLVMALAQQHYDTLKTRARTAARRVTFADGGGSPARKGFRDKIIVGVTSTQSE
jgi:hypothetical protein